jgi:putative transposase
VPLAERQLRVQKPRLRRKGAGQDGEVEVPAYAALLSNSRLGRRMLEIMLRGVSTRNYQEVLPRMAETVGVSKSSVSREFVEASAATLQQLAERCFAELDLLIIYIDGLVFGNFHVLAAIGVDSTGKKHVLGLKEGGSENAVVATALLQDLVERGVNPVQRCRRHKERNVQGYLPDDQGKRVLQVMKAAWKLPAKEGVAKLEKEASYLEKEHPSAAASLREGLAEMFTVNRLGLPSTLSRCLCSTNLIESCFSGGRDRTRRVTNWQSGDMALRWSASALLETEKKFHFIMGHKQLWMLKAELDSLVTEQNLAEARQVG